MNDEISRYNIYLFLICSFSQTVYCVRPLHFKTKMYARTLKCNIII